MSLPHLALFVIGSNSAALAGGLGMLAMWDRLVPYEPGEAIWIFTVNAGAAVASLLGWAVLYEAFVI